MEGLYVKGDIELFTSANDGSDVRPYKPAALEKLKEEAAAAASGIGSGSGSGSGSMSEQTKVKGNKRKSQDDNNKDNGKERKAAPNRGRAAKRAKKEKATERGQK
jgi:hypothetical protein